MKITVLDGSNYFKGLLLLIRKDCKINDAEVHLMKRFGKALGLEPSFCENAIREIMENAYIEDSPPKFLSKELAMRFVRDAVVLAYSDKHVHSAEIGWLKSVAEINDLDPDSLRWEGTNAAYDGFLVRYLEVDNLTVEYS